MYLWTVGSSPISWPWSTTGASPQRRGQSSSPNLPFHRRSRTSRLSWASQLFTRIGHRVNLTPAGSALLEPAAGPRDLETGRAAVAEVAGVLAGSLSLASLPTLAADPMAGMVGAFRRHYQGVRVELAAPEDSDDLFALVESGTCEVGLTDALDVPVNLTAIALGTQEPCSSSSGSAPGGRDPLDALERGRSHSSCRPVVHRHAGCSTSSSRRSVTNPHWR